MDRDRPFVLIVCHALTGHLSPLIRISKGLCQLGWTVSFLGPTVHQLQIEASGAEFFPLQGVANLNDKLYYEQPPSTDYPLLHWAERAQIDLRLQCIEPLPTQWANFKSVLTTLHERDADRQVLVIAEAFFLGILPLSHGALLPAGVKRPKTVCVSVTVPALRSVDLPPVGELLDEKLLNAGASRGVGETVLSGINYTCHSVILQLGVPGFEYPRSDWPGHFKFAGLVQGLPKSGADPPFAWWEELKRNSSLSRGDPGKKKVVVVAQGTVEVNPGDLIVPTINAFAERVDVTVIAILGWKNATLSALPIVPSNAKVADYLSYDAVLEHADVWVHNAGFGAVNHGIAHGVPMVVAGEGQDKTENARRVAWTGIGVDLGTAKPSVEQVKDGIEQVLQNGDFTERIGLLKRQSEELNCFGTVHTELLRLVSL